MNVVKESRAAQRHLFLQKHGWHSATCVPMAGDASRRHYYRVQEKWHKSVLMDSPVPAQDIHPFIQIARRLQDYGFSAPEVFASDVEGGFLLLEDFGDDTFNTLLSQGADERTLYAQATDLLIQLAQRSGAGTSPTDPTGQLGLYPIETALNHVALINEWLYPELHSKALDQKEIMRYEALWRDCLPLAYQSPLGMTLYDYMVDNLIWLPDRQSPASVGLLDFQDAVWAPVTYDLASLLEDARRDVSLKIKEEMQDRFFAAFPETSRDIMEISYAIMAAQRNCRILGLFIRLWRRDGKPRYVQFIERVWRYFEQDLQHPALSSLKLWFDEHFPREKRQNPAQG